MSISFQLYSARNFTPWEDVLATLAQLGYTRVEGFGGNFDDPEAFRKLLDNNGLSMPSGHFSLDSLELEFEQMMEVAATLGMQHIVCPFLLPEQRPDNRAGWEALAGRLQVIGEKVQAAGYSFAWHNHDFEFTPCADDGSIPMAILLDKVPELNWEADIAWIVRGGADPLEWIARYGQRIHMAHTKDIAPPGECADEDGWADVGHGVMDWQALTAALQSAGTLMFVMEHDNPNDLTRFAGRSLQTVQALLEQNDE